MNALFYRHRLSRDERLDQAFEILQRSLNPLPVKVLAHSMGLQVTPYLRGILDQLVKDGFAIKTYHDMPIPLNQICLYEIADEHKPQEKAG